MSEQTVMFELPRTAAQVADEIATAILRDAEDLTPGSDMHTQALHDAAVARKIGGDDGG
jgi:hypothetical protein